MLKDVSEPLYCEHEEKLNQIQNRATELLAQEIKDLIKKINTSIDDGSIDEGIAKAISKGGIEYCVIQINYNPNINYDLALKDVIKRLKSIYEPTYTVRQARSYGGYYQEIWIIFDNACIIL